MQVNKVAGDVARTEAAQRTQQSGAAAAPQAAVEAISEVRRVDEVEISDAGRALAGAGDTPDAATDLKASTLDPRRMDEIRSKILSGAYNSLEMADHVARALVRSGDL